MTVGIVITNRIFYPSDLVNAKTTIPLRVGEERWIHTSTRRVSVYMLWFKFSFGAKFLKLVQFLFSFVVYSLP